MSLIVEYLQMLHNKHETWMTLNRYVRMVTSGPGATIDAMEDFTQEHYYGFHVFYNVYEFIEALNENAIEDVRISRN